MTDRPPSATDSSTPAERQLAPRQVVSASVSLAVMLFTAIVVARAITGHLKRGLHAPGVFAVYFVLTLVAAGAVWYRLGPSRRLSLAQDAGRTGNLLAVAIVCPLLTAMVLGRHLSAGMLLLLWSLTAVWSGGALWLLLRRGDTRPTTEYPPVPHRPPQPSIMAVPVMHATAVESATPDTVAPSAVTDDEAFTQRWTRRQGELGDELEGILKIDFAAGQRTATADIPIVPAMAGIPDVDCEPLHAEDSNVQVIVRSVHTYGVRIELQRPAERTAAEEIDLAVLIHSEGDAES